ncbi:MAG TPA: acyl carrier protein [Candidatus Bipolaricaulota bacterium]
MGENLTREEITEKVKSIILDKLDVEEADITDDASFIESLGADSLDTVEMIMELEDEFNLEIPDEAAEKLSTVGDAIRYIHEHLAK